MLKKRHTQTAEELFFVEAFRNGLNAAEISRRFQEKFPGRRSNRTTLNAKINKLVASALEASKQISDQTTKFDLNSFYSNHNTFVLEHVLAAKSNGEIVPVFFEAFPNTLFTQEDVETFINRLRKNALKIKTSFSALPKKNLFTGGQTTFSSRRGSFQQS